MISLLPDYREFIEKESRLEIALFGGAKVLIGEIATIDLEDETSLRREYDRILELIKHSDQNCIYRFNLETKKKAFNESGAFRDGYLKGSTYFDYKAYFSVENSKRLFQKNREVDFWPKIKTKAISKETFLNLFETLNIERSSFGLEVNATPVGIISVFIPNGEGNLSLHTLYKSALRTRSDVRISLSFKRISEERAEYIIDKKIGNARVNRVGGGDLQLERLNELKIRSRTTSEAKFLVELKVIVKEKSEEKLRESLKTLSHSLRAVGDTYIEGCFGAGSAYTATLPGSKQHLPFLEFESGIPFYAPIFREGVSSQRKDRRRAVPLLRMDDSYEDIDIFADEYSGFNVLINGKPGSGKSVLGNLISSSLLNDPKIHMIKVDVGGSYVNECKYFNGTEVTFNLNEPSGINPFSDLNSIRSNNDAAGIISELISSLSRESEERELPKSVKASIEEETKAYIDSCPLAPSFDDYFEKAKGLPRRDILKRFVKGGIFENTFKDRGIELSNRYTYFNFEHIQNASNQDFTQGVIAAVIAKVNVEALKLGNGRTGESKRLVLHNDECQFFLKVNPHYYEVTVANLRKYGHATILMAQSTESFIVPSTQGYSTGILKNSPIRFFSQIDGDGDRFQERFGLSDLEVARIKSFSWGHESRSFLLQDELKTRVVRVKLTGEEFWRVTTDRRDREKLEGLMKAVPYLKLEEAYRCLSL